MPIKIVSSDITKLRCDAVVNPTDQRFSGSGGTDRAIHLAAGKLLDWECKMLPPLSTGRVAVTGAYKLPARYIIHTVGPVWSGGDENEEILLRSCYLSALIKARQLKVNSIAFPLISAGTFGFPKDRVLRIAMEAISEYLNGSDAEMEVYLCVYNRNAYELRHCSELERFLNRIEESYTACRSASVYDAVVEDYCSAPSPRAMPVELSDWIKKQDDSFALMLLKLIDKKGMTDIECYKKANVSRKTFWKINNDPKYRPAKSTILAFAIALELDMDETEQLLKTAGFSLSHSNTFDMILEFYIQNGIYDIYEINAALYQYDQVCLGC